MALKDLRLLNDEELEEFKKLNVANPMLVVKHRRWLYEKKIAELKKLGLNDLIPEWEEKLEELSRGKNSADKGKPKSKPSVPKKTKKRAPEAVFEVGSD